MSIYDLQLFNREAYPARVSVDHRWPYKYYRRWRCWGLGKEQSLDHVYKSSLQLPYHLRRLRWYSPVEDAGDTRDSSRKFSSSRPILRRVTESQKILEGPKDRTCWRGFCALQGRLEERVVLLPGLSPPPFFFPPYRSLLSLFRLWTLYLLLIWTQFCFLCVCVCVVISW